ncbi:MAG: hypothetical protein HY815_06990 [Candidatus Riflebacteria bacterium]|nr:hypothetical protein [Candidatus Riflebacteria bacterium]
MADKLSWDEIKETYADEWIALVDHVWPNTEPVPLSGIVYAHSPDHATLIEMAKHLNEAAIVWTGKKRGEKLRAALRVDRQV